MRGSEPWDEGPGLATSLWQHRVVVVLGLALGAALGYAGALAQPTVYEATGELVMESGGGSSVLITDAEVPRTNPQRDLRNRVEQLRSAATLEAASERLDGALAPRDVDRAVTIGYSEDFDVITIQAAAAEPQQAADLVNAVGEAYMAASAQAAAAAAGERVAQIEVAIVGLDARIAALEDQLTVIPDSETLTAQRDAAVGELIDLSSRAQRLAVVQQLPPTGVSSFEQALPPRSPSQPRPRISAALGGLLGLGLAGAFAYWRAGRVMAATDAARAARILGVPLLGSIPEFASARVPWWRRWRLPRAAGEEPYRFVALPVARACQDLGGAIVAVTSANAGDGKTAIASGVATAAATYGVGVTVVDGDPVERTLSRQHELLDSPGLTDVARDEVGHGVVRRLLDASGGGLHILPIGRATRRLGGLLNGRSLRDVLAAPLAAGELLLVDCGDILTQSDAAVFAAQADAVLIVVRHGTRVRDLELLKERTAWGQTQILGVVFCGDRSRAARRRAADDVERLPLQPAPELQR